MISDATTRPVFIRQFKNLQEYTCCWQEMKTFTAARTQQTQDEIWLLEHEPVFTQGIRENVDDIHNVGEIPLVKTDRGGLVTYHGPGQLMVYLMLDIKSSGTGLKSLVSTLEQATIDLLSKHRISAARRENAPGVYVEGRKIASIGLRVQHGCTYHGLSLNVDMDLSPYDRIVPCGLSDISMTDMNAEGASTDVPVIGRQFIQVLSRKLGYNSIYDSNSRILKP